MRVWVCVCVCERERTDTEGKHCKCVCKNVLKLSESITNVCCEKCTETEGKHFYCMCLGERMQPPKNPGNYTLMVEGLTLCLSSTESWISRKGKWTLFSNYCWWMTVQNDYQINAFSMSFLWPHLVGQTSWERTAVQHHSRQNDKGHRKKECAERTTMSATSFPGTAMTKEGRNSEHKLTEKLGLGRAERWVEVLLCECRSVLRYWYF